MSEEATTAFAIGGGLDIELGYFNKKCIGRTIQIL